MVAFRAATLAAEHPGTAVLVLTMNADDDSILAALRCGERGYLLKAVTGGWEHRGISATTADGPGPPVEPESQRSCGSPRPASRARVTAWARSVAWSLANTLEAWFRVTVQLCPAVKSSIRASWPGAWAIRASVVTSVAPSTSASAT